jgi:hypothetical protein
MSIQERSYIVQKTSIGVETTPGTAVPTTQQLQTLSVDTEAMVTVQDFRPIGYKYITTVALQKEWVVAPLKGYPAFSDIVYPLSSVINTPVITEIMDGAIHTGAFKWVFDSNVSTEDNPKTFTIEQGSAVRAQKFTNAIVHDIGLKFSRSAVELTGNLLAQRLQDNIVLTGGLGQIPIIPMLASGFDVFIDPTFGALGTTKMGRLFDGDFKLGNRFGPLWVVDSSQASFANTVETTPTSSFTMIVEADAAGMAYLQTMRRGTTVFARIRNLSATATGANVDGVTAYGGRQDVGATWASGSNVILDPTCVAGDTTKPVAGILGSQSGIPAGAIVNVVTAGVSFTYTGAPTTRAGAGVAIGGQIPYSFTLDVALKVSKTGKFTDQEGVYAIEFDFTTVADGTWTKAFHAEVVNTLATL